MDKQSKWIIGATALGTVVVVALFGIRLASNLSLSEPLQLQTSGFEQESLYAIWKYINGRDVYTFTHEIPFTFSNFNWLYYVFYGSLTGLALDVLNLADAWLPTVTRIITILGAALGTLVAYRTMTGFASDQNTKAPGMSILALGLSALVFFGPLAGFWTLTTRPDIWTAAIEALLILGFMRFYPRFVMGATLWVLVMGYVVWSFKTVDITAAGGVGVFLLWRRHWLAAAVLAVGTVGSWAATYGLGTDAYRFSMLGAHQAIIFALDQGIRNVANFAIKMLPVILPLTVLVWLCARQRAMRSRIAGDAELQFLIIAALCSLTVSLLGSFKVGGAENYFFTPSLIMALLVYKVWSLSDIRDLIAETGLRLVGAALIAGWVLTGAATASVIAGLNGVLSQRPMHDRAMQMMPCLQDLSGPVFVNDMYLALPWITPSDQNFLLSFYYHVDRASGQRFEADGIGGLIRNGYFNALVFEKPLSTFDGAGLSGYRQQTETCGGWVVYKKAP